MLNVTAIHVFDISNFILSLNIDENDLQNFTTNFRFVNNNFLNLQIINLSPLQSFLFEPSPSRVGTSKLTRDICH